MATDFKILGRGLKQLAILLLLMIASPILLSLAFKALAVYKEGTGLIVSWIFLVISALLMLFTILYAFRTFRTILSSIFHEK